ncbi:DUF3530 family protein [Alteromonas facilis]|uniref:DUF3530 family protein n=1 Tax=Alteromonas facilis TaxID=2048004 RepID=UPI0013DA179A|nr:DUF3530 family protein [Alteromonas facilis]
MLTSSFCARAQSLPTSELFATDAQNRLAKGTIEMVLAGTEQVPVTSTPASVPLTRGVAIIISDHLDGLFGNEGLSLIQKSLNQWGWHTVIVPAPVPNLTSSEDTGSGDEINALSAHSAFSQEAMSRYVLALSQRVEAAGNMAQTTPGYRLVIARGISAAGLVQLYSQGSLQEPDGLVIAGPFWPEQQLNQSLPAQLATTAFPVLDITSEWDNRWSLQTIEQRRVKAITELKLHYRQRDIIGTVFTTQQYQALAKQIYGWVTYLGW